METKRPIDPGRRSIALAAVVSLALVNYSVAQTVTPEKPVTARPKVVSVGAKMSTAPVDSSVKRTGGFHDNVASPQGPTEQAVLPVPTKPQPAPPAPVTPMAPVQPTYVPQYQPTYPAYPPMADLGPGRRVLLHAAAAPVAPVAPMAPVVPTAPANFFLPSGPAPMAAPPLQPFAPTAFAPAPQPMAFAPAPQPMAFAPVAYAPVGAPTGSLRPGGEFLTPSPVPPARGT